MGPQKSFDGGDPLAKMVFALPDARSVLRDLTQPELHALAAQQETARSTDYGAVNVHTEVLARSKASTYIVVRRA